ncbi:hypothetical protein OPQ81_002234 [Rhizoctonia solani]|nr:hypothetical protein OPQ81_002234 [Rhizoctonia solani]
MDDLGVFIALYHNLQRIDSILQWPVAFRFRTEKLIWRKGGGNVRSSRLFQSESLPLVFLRFRVLAQGITVAACVGGTLVYGHYNKQEKDSERLQGPLGPPPTTAAQRRTEESIEELVARAEALERAQARGSNARDTLMAALMKQKAEKAEWARQKEQAAAENK